MSRTMGMHAFALVLLVAAGARADELLPTQAGAVDSDGALEGPTAMATDQAVAAGLRPVKGDSLLRLLPPQVPTDTSKELIGLAAQCTETECLINQQDYVVHEYDYDVLTDVYVKNLDRLEITAQGKIWAGVWFTGENDANGWVGWRAGREYPLPDFAPYSFLVDIDNRVHFAGTSFNATYFGAGSRLGLRINDNVPGNGSGAFSVTIKVWEPRPQANRRMAIQVFQNWASTTQANITVTATDTANEAAVSGTIWRDGSTVGQTGQPFTYARSRTLVCEEGLRRPICTWEYEPIVFTVTAPEYDPALFFQE